MFHREPHHSTQAEPLPTFGAIPGGGSKIEAFACMLRCGPLENIVHCTSSSYTIHLKSPSQFSDPQDAVKDLAMESSFLGQPGWNAPNDLMRVSDQGLEQGKPPSHSHPFISWICLSLVSPDLISAKEILMV